MKINIKEMLMRRVGDAYSEVEIEDFIIISQQIILQRRYGFVDNYPTEFPDRYLITCFQIALYLISKDGAEGQLAHSEGGISRTYANANIPEDLLVDVVPYAGVL